MPLAFTAWDWAIITAYVVILAIAGFLATRRNMQSADEYFLAGHQAPVWLVAVSVLSTTQSAATFLGAPDYAFRGDYTYLTGSIAALLGAWFVAHVLMPRFYAARATTVYELLEQRFDVRARRAAGAMYLVGRVLASGSRLYLAAIAVSMMMFLDVTADHIIIASLVLTLFGIVFTLMGGLNAVIWSDLVQVILYLGAALMVLIFLLVKIPVPISEIWNGLALAPDGTDKLRLFDLSTDFTKPFTLMAVFTGLILLNIGNAGLDQDTTQRLLACRDAKSGSRALYASVLASIPVILVFLMIGSLLHIFYERPEMMAAGTSSVSKSFGGEKITVFMHFILSEIPPGLRGLVTVGVIAAAAINSGLISMASVLVNDFYRPHVEQRHADPEQHLIKAGRFAVVLMAGALFAMSALCFYWQRYANTPLLEFVLSVMVFAYSGLLGVYGVAVFTSRGSTASVMAALVAGFVTILVQQAYVVDLLGLPPVWKTLAFPWQLCIGTIVAFLTCYTGNSHGRGVHR